MSENKYDGVPLEELEVLLNEYAAIRPKESVQERVKRLQISPVYDLAAAVRRAREKRGLIASRATALQKPSTAPEATSAPTPDQEQTTSGVSLNSENFSATVKDFPTNEFGLAPIAALFGSTNYDWRTGKDQDDTTIKIEHELNTAGLSTYNPDMGSRWQPPHSAVEAEAMKKCQILLMRIENAPGVKDGSLGSLTEIPNAILSAKLRGQHLVISFSEDFEKSLEDPLAIAQFASIKSRLEQAGRDGEISIAYTESRQGFVERIKKIKDEPLPSPLSKEALQKFKAERDKRLAKDRLLVTIGGSSAPFHPSLEETFTAEQDMLGDAWSEHQVERLNRGLYASAWEKVDALIAARNLQLPDKPVVDNLQIQEACQRAFNFEAGTKKNADVLIWTIQNEAISQAAVTEIGFLVMDALKTGQQFILLMEPFDADLYVQKVCAENATNLSLFVDTFISTHQLGRDYSAADLAGAQTIIQNLQLNPEKVTFENLAKNNILKNSAEFNKADRARRVRAVAEQQLLKLQETVTEMVNQGIELFMIATDHTDLMQKMSLINSKRAYEDRTEYFDNFGKVQTELQNIIAAEQPNSDLVVDVIDRALAVVSPPEKRYPPLTQHLQEVTAYSGVWKNILNNYTNADGQPYLSPHQLELIEKYVAPLHDLFKFLGKPDVQSIPDHEMIAGLITNTYLPQMGLPLEDVAFIAGLISDHENIFKESGRAAFALSNKPVERAKSLFFIIDTLTGAVAEENGVLKINDGQLQTRFTDLYLRHLAPVHNGKVVAPELGKVFRPEWGVSSIKDFIAFFKAQEQYGLKLEPGFLNKIIAAGIESIDIALTKNQERENNKQIPVFNSEQSKQLEKTRQELQSLYQATY